MRQQILTRFGPVLVQPHDLLLFPQGLIGWERLKHWVVLKDRRAEALLWLQSAQDPLVAVAVVSPRRFVPGYQLRLSRHELQPLDYQKADPVEVLLVLSRHGEQLTVNLKAPVLVNLRSGRGVQVVHPDSLPMAFPLAPGQALRRCA